MALSTETSITSLADFIDVNAKLASEVYNDAKMAPAEKLRNLSVAVRNQVMLSRQQAANRSEAFKLGMKLQGYNALVFDPGTPDQASLVAQPASPPAA